LFKAITVGDDVSHYAQFEMLEKNERFFGLLGGNKARTGHPSVSVQTSSGSTIGGRRNYWDTCSALINHLANKYVSGETLAVGISLNAKNNIPIVRGMITWLQSLKRGLHHESELDVN